MAHRRLDATLALRDLFLARPDLDGAADRAAARLLARPTDGIRDPYGDGYAAPATQKCSKHFCIHWVRFTIDAPPSTRWVTTTLTTMEQVWKHHVGKLGYHKPANDRGRGGNDKFDVYLKELGSQGLYGYCAPERPVPGHKQHASGFCVLDNDFSRSQYHREPLQTLRVTAAHEFFHAIQFAYDFREDPWFLESTATWMEERFADRVNDNRSYLPYGQLARPSSSLDLFAPGGFNQYGNWPFWEFLSQRYGNSIVRKVMLRAGAGRHLPNDYSIEAVQHVLAAKGGLGTIFAAYAAGNTVPARTYGEGKAFPRAAFDGEALVSRSNGHYGYSTKINHLASKSVRLVPAKGLGTKWRLRIKIDAPSRKTGPAAFLIVQKSNGELVRDQIPLDGTGAGRTTVPFSHRKIVSVSVTMANVSTHFRCRAGTTFSCKGAPRDQGQQFHVGVTAVKG